MSGLAIMLLFIKHAIAWRHMLKGGRRFIIHHPLFDFILVSLLVVSSFMLSRFQIPVVC